MKRLRSSFITLMKTTAAIFLMILLVSTQTPMGQLFKLPLLIEHFVKHQKQGGMSLLGFLVEHYTSDHRDADLPEDEQLPFKTIILCNLGNAIVPSLVKTDFSLPATAEKKIMLPDVYSPQQHLSSIFHPPRG
jgi:hypothetical protein